MTLVHRVIQDILWNLIIRGRVQILGDINKYSPIWNPQCYYKQNAGPLE